MVRKKYINGLFTISKGNKALHDNNIYCILLGYRYDPKFKNSERLLYKCTLCNSIGYSTWGNLIKKKISCIHCLNNQKCNERRDTLLKYIQDNTDGYELLSDKSIKTTMTKIKLKHLCCGNILETNMHHFIDDEIRCHSCCKSSGEAIVKEFLNINNIKYIQEYRFNNLTTGKLNNKKSLMSVDFWLPNKQTIIEYQGKQHYTAGNWSKGIDYLQKYKKYDSIKVSYAKKHGYLLLTPNYKMKRKDIFKYLSNYLCNAE